jgi:hypothetical protein
MLKFLRSYFLITGFCRKQLHVYQKNTNTLKKLGKVSNTDVNLKKVNTESNKQELK